MKLEAKMPESPKSFERKYAEFTAFMVSEMAARYKNQVLKELNQATVEKFADTQTGNYAVILTQLAKRVKRKLLRQFDDDRIDKKTREILGGVNKYNQDQLYGTLGEKIGIDPLNLKLKEGLTPQINALMLETAAWSKKMRDDNMAGFTANTLMAMARGETMDDIIKTFDKNVMKSKAHAKFLARNQIMNFNAISTKIRAQKLGIEEAIWVTARDERVRRCHDVRDGKKFKLSEGLYSSCDGLHLLPGVDFNCRCISKVIIPEGAL